MSHRSDLEGVANVAAKEARLTVSSPKVRLADETQATIYGPEIQGRLMEEPDGGARTKGGTYEVIRLKLRYHTWSLKEVTATSWVSGGCGLGV